MNNKTHLPSNQEAEQGVLGSILYQPRLISQVADKLKPSDFYYASLRHADIYQAMLHLYNQEIEIDTATISHQLERAGITAINGLHPMSYIHDLWTKGLEELPSLKDDANLVLNCSTLRRIHRFIGEVGEITQEENDAQKALDKIQARLSAINEGVETSDLMSLADVMDAFVADLDTRQRDKGKLTGISTGLDDLDSYLGGMQKQELIILGGRPGEGKTSLMLNILYHLIKSLHLHVAVFSLEMSRIDLARRLVSMATEIDSQFLRTRWLEDHQWNEVIDKTSRQLSSHTIFIDESGDLSISSMKTKLDRHKARYGLDMIIVDYLQLMQSDDEHSKETDVQQLSKISRGLKKLAKQFDVPVLALASLNRAAEGRADKRPQMSDLRGSGSIESDADVVMFIMQSRERKGYSLVNIEKHRNGPIGDVTLRFDPTLTRFSNNDDMEEVQNVSYS